MGYMIVNNELYHHGILGQKWGKKNGPPYPLGASDHSDSEKKAGWRKSLSSESKTSKKKSSHKQEQMSNKSSTKSKNSVQKTLKKFGNRRVNYTDKEPDIINKKDDAKSLLGLSDADSEKLQKIAKIAGISLATTAGVFAAGYAISKMDFSEDLSSLMVESNKDQLLDATAFWNADERNETKSFKLGDDLFENWTNGNYIGVTAALSGYDEIDSNFLKDAVNASHSISDGSYNNLVANVRKNFVDSYGIFGGARRRLSCWSASNAYFMSAMTGRDFISKSFMNVVDFNDFGKLYKNQPQIFNALGEKASDFVGKFGSDAPEATRGVAKSLVKNIFKNINSNNNLTPDGTRTIGFINAAYHRHTCTHQFNFEIIHGFPGSKKLVIADGWSGERYSVGRTIGNKVIFSSGFNKLVEELETYNAASIRFYAPSVDSINFDMMAKVILGKT